VGSEAAAGVRTGEIDSGGLCDAKELVIERREATAAGKLELAVRHQWRRRRRLVRCEGETSRAE